MFPHGSVHVMRDAPGRKAVNVQKLLKSNNNDGNRSLSYGGGGSAHHSGLRVFRVRSWRDQSADFLSSRSHSHQGRRGAGRPLAGNNAAISGERNRVSTAGRRTVIGHLTDIIFIQAVRAYISSAGTARKDWPKPSPIRK